MGHANVRAGMLLLVLLALPMAAGAGRSGRLVWSNDVQQAWRAARAQRRPLLLYTFMHGCPYCRLMERRTLSDARVVADIQRSFVTAAAEVSRQPELVRRLAVHSFPTLVVIDTNGQVIDAITGYMPPERLIRQLHRVGRR